ncbi:MAG: cobalamin-independent methionine synthase II family protein, partial [Actinomycetota bacterium]
MITARSDVVGSLLRPPELLEAQRLAAAGELAPGDLKIIEDRAVDRSLHLQSEAGMEVVTDGEMRRLSFQSQLVAAVDGFSEWDIDAFLWGNWRSDDLGSVDIDRPPLTVRDKLSRRRWLSADEFSYARGRTEAILKVTLPSPSLFANFWDPQTSTDAYGTLEDFLSDVAQI